MIVCFITVEATIVEPWRIGAPEESPIPGVLQCHRTPLGELEVPASSIAGALRQLLAETGTGDGLAGLMGSPPPTNDSESSDDRPLVPSRIRVLGARLVDGDRKTTFEKSTAIDPRSGAARVRTLREAETVPAGSRLKIHLRFDLDRADVDADRTTRDALLAELVRWRFFVGRGRTSGHGATEVTRVLWGELDLTRPDHLRDWLALGGVALIDRVATTEFGRSGGNEASTGPTRNGLLPRPLDTPISMQARDAVLIGGAAPPGSAGNEKFARRRGKEFVLPGTAMKGVLRSRAGYILRSLGTIAEDQCLEAEGCGMPSCPLCHLFGSTMSRGVIRVRDSILKADSTVTRTHVAIDRFTGGAADQRLYTDKDIPFRPTMSLELEALGQAPEWASTLLTLVLLDMHDGFVTVGARGTTGLGHFELEDTAVARFVDHLSSASLTAQLEEWQASIATDDGIGGDPS